MVWIGRNLRSAVGSLPSRRGYPAPAQLPAAAGHAGGICLSSCPAHAEGADPDERQVATRDQRHYRQDRHGHHRGHSEGGEESPPAGPAARPEDQVRREDHRQVATGALAAGAHLRAGPGAGALPDLSGHDCPVRPGKSKPSWSVSKTAATASLPLPMARSATRRTRPASMSRTNCTG